MSKRKLLDLCSGSGGAAVGYHRAGFDVVGVDNRPMPRYPFEFVLGDALEYLVAHGHEFDGIHASPPCQRYSVLAAMHKDREYPDLLPATRALLISAGKPYVIENVETAPMDSSSGFWGHGVMLCGSMFELGVTGRGYLRRHRCFETSFPVPQPKCRHDGMAVGVYGHGGHSGKHRMLYRKEAAIAMGIDWMTRDGLSQAIPPAYTEFLGRFLITHLTESALEEPHA